MKREIKTSKELGVKIEIETSHRYSIIYVKEICGQGNEEMFRFLINNNVINEWSEIIEQMKKKAEKNENNKPRDKRYAWN